MGLGRDIDKAGGWEGDSQSEVETEGGRGNGIGR